MESRKMVPKDLFAEQQWRNRQRTDLWTQGEGRRERDGVGIQGWQIKTIICRKDKQGPTIQHRELYSVSCDKS